MEKESISPGQLFALIFLFEMGTALVVPIGLKTSKDVWLSIFAALFGGILLFLLYDYLQRQYPKLPLSGYARKILGPYIGWLLSFIYIPFFIYGASRDLRDAGELLKRGIYDETPLIVILSLMIIVVIYALYKGIEVLARTAEISLFFMFVLGVVGNLLILFSGIIKVDNLLPFLEEGWRPILKNAYPNIFMFPFGEMICFTAIFPFLNKSQSRRKTGVGALLLSGIVLSFIHTIKISVLGTGVYGRSPLPLFDTVKRIQIGDFIERLDSIAILILILGDFYKIAIFCFAAVMVAADLFKVQTKQLVYPFGILVLFTSIMIAGNFPEHVQEGNLVLKSLFPLFSVGFPVLLGVVHMIRKKFDLFSSNVSVENKE
ncbi:spore germination protein [Neobacillus pocheonensis]|uniref:Spore germination protein n=1 Tax=Neobacillus pocheonensis TaxID=363869 RepID=A0ABT0W7V7_9BACI|nr:spore germination protein [Neobacillus pocheonensis]